MKICFVSAHPMTYPGGVQNHILALKEEFEKKGHRAKILFARDKSYKKGKEDEILFGRAIYFIGNASKANLSLKFTMGDIKKTLEKEKFDILHFHNFGVFLPWQVLRASEKIKNPPVKIITLHAFWDASKILKKTAKIFSNYVLTRFDGLIGVSKPVLEQINYSGISKIIPNGIDLKKFSPKGEKIKKFCDNKKNILFVGRIEKRKGLIYLLRAFELLKKKQKEIRLIVVGDGFERKKMEDFVKERKIQDVFFEGGVSEVDLPKYYRSADICCFPSLFGEAFGIVLLEAMACSKPVVAFANKGYTQVIKGKGRDFLAKPKDIKDLAKKLEILLENENIRKEMGDWGRKEAEKYSWEKIADEILDFYKKIIELKQKNK